MKNGVLAWKFIDLEWEEKGHWEWIGEFFVFSAFIFVDKLFWKSVQIQNVDKWEYYSMK